MRWSFDKPPRSGDTWSITIDADSDYPNADYVPHIRFRGPMVFTLDGVVNNLTIAVAATVSATYVAGVYDWTLYWTKGAEVHTTEASDDPLNPQPKVSILANLLKMQGGLDARSHAQKMVTLIEAALEKFAVDAVDEVEIAGRRYVKTDVSKLKGLLQEYRNELAAETTQKKRKIKYAFEPIS